MPARSGQRQALLIHVCYVRAPANTETGHPNTLTQDTQDTHTSRCLNLVTNNDQNTATSRPHPNEIVVFDWFFSSLYKITSTSKWFRLMKFTVWCDMNANLHFLMKPSRRSHDAIQFILNLCIALKTKRFRTRGLWNASFLNYSSKLNISRKGIQKSCQQAPLK